MTTWDEGWYVVGTEEGRRIGSARHIIGLDKALEAAERGDDGILRELLVEYPDPNLAVYLRSKARAGARCAFLLRDNAQKRWFDVDAVVAEPRTKAGAYRWLVERIELARD